MLNRNIYTNIGGLQNTLCVQVHMYMWQVQANNHDDKNKVNGIFIVKLK